jgi:hypothetical protein
VTRFALRVVPSEIPYRPLIVLTRQPIDWPAHRSKDRRVAREDQVRVMWPSLMTTARAGSLPYRAAIPSMVSPGRTVTAM